MKITDLKSYKVVQTATSSATTSSPAQPDQNPVAGFAQGALVQAPLKLIRGAGEIGRGIQKGLSSGVDAVAGTNGFGLGSNSPFDNGTAARQALDSAIEPDNAAQKAGQFVGDIASFVVPGTAALKATRGAGAARMITGQAASDATVQSIQQGGFDRNTIDTAILGAVFPGAGAIASAAKMSLGPKLGGRVVNSLIKPLLKDFSYGKDPGKAVAEAGITANSLDDLLNKVRSTRQSIGEEIGARLGASTELFSAEDAFKPLDEAIASAMKAPKTNSALINRLQNLKDDIFGVATFDGREIATRKLSDLTASELFELKKEVGELTRWTGNATDDELVNKALKQTYGALKEKLNTIDGIAPLNEKYANLLSAEVATEYRDKLAARQNLINLPNLNVGVGGAIVGALATGGAITPSLLIGAGAAGVREALATPAAKTRIAAWLAETPSTELRSLWADAPWLRATLQSVLFGEEESVNADAE